MQEIKLDPQEVKELLAIVDKHNGHFIDDLRQAEMIQTIAKRGEFCTTSNNVFRNSYNLMGAIFRIAYIAGQRSARRGNKRRKESPPEPLIEKATREPAQQYRERLDKQAAERREQQEFERGLKLGAMLNEYMSAGGSISKLLELIAQADTATEQAKGGVIYAG